MKRLFVVAILAASVSVSASEMSEALIKKLHEQQVRQHFIDLLNQAWENGFWSGVHKCRNAA